MNHTIPDVLSLFPIEVGIRLTEDLNDHEPTRTSLYESDSPIGVLLFWQSTYPQTRDASAVSPMEGVTLLPAFKGLEQRDEQRPLFWEYVGNHAIRKGNWKLVAERSKDWELYDLASDRSETIDLAREFPKRVAELAREYNAWAKRVGSKSHAKCLAMKPSTQSQLFELP